MKKMQKIVLVLLCLVFSLSIPVNAFAVMKVEPYSNTFFQRHSEEIVVQERTYITNAKINLYEAPDANTLVGTLDADSHCVISIHYDSSDGTAWGYVETDDASGWAKLSEMTVVYDYISFKEKYGDEITDCDEYFEFSDNFQVYAYPDSPTLIDTIDGTDMPADERIHAEEKYTAPDGRVWYFCRYLYGGENFWFTRTVLSSDIVPSDTTIDESTVVQSTVAETTTISATEDNYSKERSETITRAIIGFVLLLIMTIAALVLMLTKKEEK